MSTSLQIRGGDDVRRIAEMGKQSIQVGLGKKNELPCEGNPDTWQKFETSARNVNRFQDETLRRSLVTRCFNQRMTTPR